MMTNDPFDGREERLNKALGRRFFERRAAVAEQAPAFKAAALELAYFERVSGPDPCRVGVDVGEIEIGYRPVVQKPAPDLRPVREVFPEVERAEGLADGERVIP